MTATTYLEWEDQATGANDNTWGDVQDSNNAIFELAIARVASIATTGGTTVLTTPQNRYPIIVLTGVLVATATIQVRTAEKNWIFINKTTGNFSITVKTAAGAGVTLPRQKATKIYCDGTDCLLARNPNIPHATAGGTVDVITATFEPATASGDLQEGYLWEVTAAGANTVTTPTFNPDGTGALTITKNGGQALVAGDIRAAGHKLLLAYKSGGVELLNPNTGQFARVDIDNNFTAAQTTAVTNADTTQTVVTDVVSHLTSGTPAAGFGLERRMRLHNALNVLKNASSIVAAWVTATDAAEDARIEFWNMIAGASKAMKAYIGAGFVVGAPTGGDKGSGAINATGYYLNGKKFINPPLVRTTNNAISANTTLASDAVLTFAMEANKNYEFEAIVIADSGPSGGIKYGITGPAIGAGSISCEAELITDGGASPSVSQVTAYGTIFSGGSSNGVYMLLITGLVQNGANAGSFALQFAQSASNATPLNIRPASKLRWSEV